MVGIRPLGHLLVNIGKAVLLLLNILYTRWFIFRYIGLLKCASFDTAFDGD
ncbi:MAG: hypothetical protein KAU22_05855 [Desulfuromonadales bacterium]|nr:hypothetical protein [Desulfuromonadales bacterium]